MAAMTDVGNATTDIPQIANPRFGEKDQPPTIPDGRYMTGAQSELQFQAFDLLIMCFLKSWSFQTEITLEAVEDLDTGSKDALTTKAISLMQELMPDYGADVDPKARPSGSSVSHPDMSTEKATFEIPSYAPTS
jgi:hypothetical protein